MHLFLIDKDESRDENAFRFLGYLDQTIRNHDPTKKRLVEEIKIAFRKISKLEK